jgi:hypothetical protein
MSDIPKLAPKDHAIEQQLRSMFPARGSDVCAICHSDKIKAEDFKDEISLKEFTLSAMCQVCQDDLFQEED